MRIPGYKAERLIARGGMSSVYLATQMSLNRRVAIKVLRKFDNPRQAERFLHEARIIASLRHRNIITIHDVGTVGERHYIAMEYLEGGSLADRIDHGMPAVDALDLLESMAGCLDFVHRKDIVHRDIKPGNILFDADGTPKLTDFGIAKQIDGDQELTLEGSAFGSPYYLSPEQAEDRPLDGRSDIYGLGIVFYQMLTGRRPYEESSHIETIVAHLSDPIPVLPEGLSAYQELLEQMIAKSPDNRIGSARELRALIQQVRSAQSGRADGMATAQGDGSDNGLSARVGGVPVLTGLSAAIALLVLTVGVFWWPGDGADKEEPAPRLASRVPVVQLSYDAAKSRPGPVVVTDQSDMDTPGPPTASETIPPASQPEKSLAPVPVPEIAEQRVDGPVEVFEPVAAVAVEQPRDEADTDDAVDGPVEDPEPDALVAAVEPLQDEAETERETTDASVQLVDGWIQSGDRALAANRLTTPADDNAYSYYRKVVELDPDNQAAKQGLDRIANRYAFLARRVLAKQQRRRARLYVQRGTMVRPQHPGLRAIRAELDQQDRVAAATVADAQVEKMVVPDQEEPPIRSWEIEGTSVTSRGVEGTGNIVTDFKNVWRSVFE